jgi:hypothetical protein
MPNKHRLAITNPVKVSEYAEALKRDSMSAEVRGVLAFEDRGDGIHVFQVGSCSPPTSRMMVGVMRWVVKSLL